MRNIEVRRLGLMPYPEALALQRTLVEERRANRVGDLLLFVEHPHVLTLGVRGDGGRGHILATPEALASAINQLAQKRPRAAAMGEAGREVAVRITWDGVIEKLIGF